MLDQLDSAFAFGKQALDVRTYRQEVLSSNIANADTPKYQARDIDFSSALANSLKEYDATARADKSSVVTRPSTAGLSSLTMSVTQIAHFAGKSEPVEADVQHYANIPLKFRIPAQPALDGNTVDLDTERVQFVDNSLHYESLVDGLSGEVKGLLAAISSGGS